MALSYEKIHPTISQNSITMGKTREILLGGVPIGGGRPPVIQSMCNTRTDDAAATLAQIHALADAGCQVVRVAFPNAASADGLRVLCRESPLPVVADIHIDGRLALLALECGAHGLRVNPGNIRDATLVREIAAAAAAAGCCVRVGVNMGSLSPEAEAVHGRTAKAMVASALEYLKIFEAAGCRHLKVSLKASDLRQTCDACRQFAAASDWPQHIGVTEAGTPDLGVLKSAIGIGALLLEGIGDTLRVSLTADPVEEVKAARRILAALGMLPGRPQIVSCPTCGRTRIDLIPLVRRVEAEIDRILASGKRIALQKIAVMGCEVNGPGEAADADLGIAGGNGRGLLFRLGQKVRVFPEEQLFDVLMSELQPFIHDN